MTLCRLQSNYTSKAAWRASTVTSCSGDTLLILVKLRVIQYGDAVCNIVEEHCVIFSLIQQLAEKLSSDKIFPYLTGCGLAWADLYNGHKNDRLGKSNGPRVVRVWREKVVLANSKRQGNVRDQNEDEKMMRLFIMVPTSFTQKDIEDEFSVSLLTSDRPGSICVDELVNNSE